MDKLYYRTGTYRVQPKVRRNALPVNRVRQESSRTGGKSVLRQRLLVVLTFFLFVWSFLAFVRSDFFRLDDIKISGLVHTDEQEVLRALGPVRGYNIWQLNPSLLRQGVESIARVEAATVHRRLPGTLVVEVVEKEALVLVPYGEYLLELSGDGQVVGTTQDPQYFGLPLLTGVAPLQGTVGEFLLEGKPLDLLREALQALDRYGIPVSEINLADSANVVLVTMEGLAVWLGEREFPAKAELLAQIRSRLPKQAGKGYLDLRVKEMPVYSGENVGN